VEEAAAFQRSLSSTTLSLAACASLLLLEAVAVPLFQRRASSAAPLVLLVVSAVSAGEEPQLVWVAIRQLEVLWVLRTLVRPRSFLGRFLTAATVLAAPRYQLYIQAAVPPASSLLPEARAITRRPIATAAAAGLATTAVVVALLATALFRQAVVVAAHTSTRSLC
jgi:hypothetical protein